MIRVLVVDDSRSFRKAMSLILSRDPEMTLVGEAETAEEALSLLPGLVPDVVTLDIEMPGMGGLILTERIRRGFSARILVVSGLTHMGSRTAVEALLKGAHDILEKPANLDHNPLFRTSVLRKIHELAGMTGTLPVCHEHPRESGGLRGREFPSLLVVGGSTGGPESLSALLGKLTGVVIPPVVVVQHMPPAILPHLAERLGQRFGLDVRIAYQGESLLPGMIRIAPGGVHLLVEKREGGRLLIQLSEDPGSGAHVPSIDRTLTSVARAVGKNSIGVLLSGLGDDGARGLLALMTSGGETFAQTPETAAAPSMPSAAIGLNAVRHVLPPASIGMALAGWFGEKAS